MVSVLMAAYNAETTIVPALQSVLASSFPVYEIIVVNDGSTDRTEEKVHSIKDSRIRLLALPANEGLANALNYGLSAARYSCIMRMDADDITHPERMSKLYRIVENNPVMIAACNYAVFTTTAPLYVITNPSNHSDILKRLPLHSSLLHSAMMYRKEFITENGGYRNVPLEDYDLLLRLHKRAEFYCHPEVLHCMRLRSGSLTHNSLYSQNGAAYQMQQEYYKAGLQSFGITDSTEENALRVWREYFYGTPVKMREYRDLLPQITGKMRVAVALSYLPEPVRNLIKNLRLKQRIAALNGNDAELMRQAEKLLRKYL